MRKKTRIARAIDRVMTPEQYARVTHQSPYLYTLGSGDEALTFVGTKHTVDPNDQQFQTIAEQVEATEPDIVVVEGMQNLRSDAGTEQLLQGMDYETASKRGGEAVVAAKFALERGIPWLSPEPTDAVLARQLVMELYSPEEIVAWYTLRLLGQYQKRNETIPFSAYSAPFLAYLEAATEWPQVTYTPEAALERASTILGHDVSLHNPERAEEYTDPIPWPHRWEQQTLFNDMTRVALRCRDAAIVARVSEELLSGRRVLVVYGAGHAVMQEPAYRYLLDFS